MGEYTYRHDDALAAFDAGFTSRIGDGSGETEEAFHGALRQAACCKAGGRLLDVGSGFGRVVGMLQPFAGQLVGIEPDRGRFALCRDRNAGFRHVTILNGVASALPRTRRDRFDLITVSMVLQNVSTAACRAILSDVRALLKPNGVALIATTHFPDHRFTTQRGGEALSRDAFDLYAGRNDAQEHGLPVRLFDRFSFHEALDAAGLRFQSDQQFYYARPFMRAALAANYGVPEAALENCGLSQFALVTAGDAVPRDPCSRLLRRLRRRRVRLRPDRALPT